MFFLPPILLRVPVDCPLNQSNDSYESISRSTQNKTPQIWASAEPMPTGKYTEKEDKVTIRVKRTNFQRNPGSLPINDQNTGIPVAKFDQFEPWIHGFWPRDTGIFCSCLIKPSSPRGIKGVAIAAAHAHSNRKIGRKMHHSS